MLGVIFLCFLQLTAIMLIQVKIKNMMAGGEGDYPALANLKNVYARYDVFIGQCDPLWKYYTAIIRPWDSILNTKIPGGFSLP
jgi:hypothetical protein